MRILHDLLSYVILDEIIREGVNELFIYKDILQQDFIESLGISNTDMSVWNAEDEIIQQDDNYLLDNNNDDDEEECCSNNIDNMDIEVNNCMDMYN